MVSEFSYKNHTLVLSIAEVNGKPVNLGDGKEMQISHTLNFLGQKVYINIFGRTAVTFSNYFITKISCLFYCYFTFFTFREQKSSVNQGFFFSGTRNLVRKGGGSINSEFG